MSEEAGPREAPARQRGPETEFGHGTTERIGPRTDG